jgi:hypothetical protein
MNELQRSAVLLELINHLNRVGSWCGETHVQKCVYFGQELFGLDTAFDFELYKHGPFSFDLRDQLSSMQAEAILALQTQPPYGPSIIPGVLAKRLLERCPKTIARVKDQLLVVASTFGPKRVAELERLSTAFYISKEFDLKGVEARARMLTRLKPHIDLEEARDATGEMDQLAEKIRKG